MVVYNSFFDILGVIIGKNWIKHFLCKTATGLFFVLSFISRLPGKFNFAYFSPLCNLGTFEFRRAFSALISFVIWPSALEFSFPSIFSSVMANCAGVWATERNAKKTLKLVYEIRSFSFHFVNLFLLRYVTYIHGETKQNRSAHFCLHNKEQEERKENQCNKWECKAELN